MGSTAKNKQSLRAAVARRAGFTVFFIYVKFRLASFGCSCSLSEDEPPPVHLQVTTSVQSHLTQTTVHVPPASSRQIDSGEAWIIFGPLFHHQFFSCSV